MAGRWRIRQPRVLGSFLLILVLESSLFYLFLLLNANTQFQENPGLPLTGVPRRRNGAFPPRLVSDKLNVPEILNGTHNLTTQKESIVQRTDKDKQIMDLAKQLSCTKKEVMLSNSPLPVTGLSSFPGSGNTWVRHLIQQMTGIATASMYCDGNLRKKGFPFECNRERSKVVVIKTHEEDHYTHFKRVVLVIRNPYDALLAYTAMDRAGHTGHPSNQVLLKASNKLFNWSLWWYKDLANGTLTRFKGPVHVLQYERLKTNMAHELRKLAVFLQVNVSDNDIACTVQLQEGEFHRKTSDSEHMDILRAIYDKEKLLRMQETAEIIRKVIKDKKNLDMDVGGDVERALLKDVIK